MSGKLKMAEGLAAVQSAVHDTIQTGATGTTRTFDQAVAGLKSGADVAASGAEQVQGQARQGLEQVQTQMRQGMEKAVKGAEQLVAFSQGNAEAMMKSSQILAGGMQELSRQMMETAQAQFEQSMQALRAFAGVKSPKEALELQSSALRGAYEALVAESGRITERSMKLAEQASAPLTARIGVAMETFSSR
ncbi:MAG: phasin family protein [Janthinobacterium lividum]